MKYVFYFSLLVVAAACTSSNKEVPHSEPASAVAGEDSKQGQHAAMGVPANREVHYYNGLIGDKYSVDVTLSEYGDSVSGQYRYTSQTEFLNLKGTVKNGAYIIKEIDPFGKNSGNFTGKKDEKNEIRGSWTNGKRTFTFVFTPKAKEEQTGAVTVSTLQKDFEFEGCTCATLLLPLVTKAPTRQIQDSMNEQLSIAAFTFSDEEDICNCSEGGYAYGLISGSYEVLFNQGNILSIQWCGETMGAYPSGYCTYKNLDVRNGSLIALSDVYQPAGVDYIFDQTSSTINSRLKELSEGEEVSEDSQDWIAELSAERAFGMEVLNEFSFDEKGITIRYDIGFPHAIQCYEPDGDVFFPYEDLEKWKKKGGVLGAK